WESGTQIALGLLETLARRLDLVLKTGLPDLGFAKSRIGIGNPLRCLCVRCLRPLEALARALRSGVRRCPCCLGFVDRDRTRFGQRRFCSREALSCRHACGGRRCVVTFGSEPFPVGISRSCLRALLRRCEVLIGLGNDCNRGLANRTRIPRLQPSTQGCGYVRLLHVTEVSL